MVFFGWTRQIRTRRSVSSASVDSFPGRPGLLGHDGVALLFWSYNPCLDTYPALKKLDEYQTSLQFSRPRILLFKYTFCDEVCGHYRNSREPQESSPVLSFCRCVSSVPTGCGDLSSCSPSGSYCIVFLRNTFRCLQLSSDGFLALPCGWSHAQEKLAPNLGRNVSALMRLRCEVLFVAIRSSTREEFSVRAVFPSVMEVSLPAGAAVPVFWFKKAGRQCGSPA